MSKTKQVVILSGKGGTGKTSFTASLAHLGTMSDGKDAQVFVDADVDAANLSLLLMPQHTEAHEFWGGSLASIDPERCIGCAECVPVCRYDAIFPAPDNPDVYWVDPVACDGCAACVYACPQACIIMLPQQEGLWQESDTQWGKLFHAELFPGRENSGKLVTLIRQKASLCAAHIDAETIIIDGPPGIGCPVISACTGTDLAVIVTEPSMAGFHDLKRVMGVIQHFNIPALICINKADIYAEGTHQIQVYAQQAGIEIVGMIPYDEHVSKAILLGQPVTLAFPESQSAQAIQNAWKNIKQVLDK